MHHKIKISKSSLFIKERLSGFKSRICFEYGPNQYQIETQKRKRMVLKEKTLVSIWQKMHKVNIGSRISDR